jgi:hypothetical protein
LADKLAALEPQLSESERALLTGILGVTADAASGGQSPLVRQGSDASTPVEVDVEGPLPSLRDEFVRAFTPGRLGSTGGGAAAPEVTTTVGITIRF